MSGLIRLYRGIVIQIQIYVNSGLPSLNFITFFKFVLKLTKNKSYPDLYDFLLIGI